MTAYFIQTPTGEEGPFSVEELRKKSLTADTLLRHEGISWTAAGKIEALRTILPETGPPQHFKKHEGSKNPFSASVIKEPKTKSRVSILQMVTIVLVLLNGVVYYYKEVRQPSASIQQAAALPPAPVKEIVAVQTVQTTKPEEVKPVDTLSMVRNNWSNLIKASANKFDFYTSKGGIRHLQAIVQNQTNFPLDTVLVAVKYIRGGETFKTEYVTLYNVPERGELAVPAPNSRSGTAVTLDILRITSEKMKFLYSTDIAPTGGEDPYLKL